MLVPPFTVCGYRSSVMMSWLHFGLLGLVFAGLAALCRLSAVVRDMCDSPLSACGGVHYLIIFDLAFFSL